MNSIVLVVEDEPAIQELVAVNLEHAGYRVWRAASAEDADAMVRDEGDPEHSDPRYVDARHRAINPEYLVLKGVCTHLGCTPNWLDAEQKFKRPCHGSGFYKDGINFEGPAPRPLERYAIRRADDGQIEVDKSRIFQEEMGQWADPMSFIQV